MNGIIPFQSFLEWGALFNPTSTTPEAHQAVPSYSPAELAVVVQRAAGGLNS